MAHFDTDVFVLGGGPAGLATAIACRRAGLRVLLADGRRPPIDKACGEGLMPDSLQALSELGVTLPCDGGRPIRGIRYQDNVHGVSAEFPNGPGIALRRTALHAALVNCAEGIGVETHWSSPVTSFEGNLVHLSRKQIRARWVIGADGAQSAIRRWVGLDVFRRSSRRFSVRRHYRTAALSQYVEVFWGDGFQLYISPVGLDEICLAMIGRDPHAEIETAVAQTPRLHGLLSGSVASSTRRGAIAATCRLRRVTRENVALVGDASGTIDPISGEGLCLAFKQAAAVRDALLADDLPGYESAHRRLSMRPRFMADFMLTMNRSTVVRKRALAAFEQHPDSFAAFLALHVGEWSARRFMSAALAFAWCTATVRGRSSSIWEQWQ